MLPPYGCLLSVCFVFGLVIVSPPMWGHLAAPSASPKWDLTFGFLLMPATCGCLQPSGTSASWGVYIDKLCADTGRNPGFYLFPLLKFLSAGLISLVTVTYGNPGPGCAGPGGTCCLFPIM